MLEIRQLSSYLHLILIILFTTLLGNVLSIHSTQPILLNPNTESSQSNFMFNFMLNNPLSNTGYLLITFTPYN